MKNLTFIEYAIANDFLNGCVVLAEYIWEPEHEDEPFYDFAYGLLSEIFEDYKKENDKTKSLLHAIQDIVYISKMIEKRAIEKGEKENEKRQANSLIFE